MQILSLNISPEIYIKPDVKKTRKKENIGGDMQVNINTLLLPLFAVLSELV